MKTVITLTLLLISVTTSFAASTDAARVAGDLKVDGIHFSTDGSVITNLSDAIGPPGVKGDPGTNGVTPTVTVESAGSNCIYGGVKVQVGNGTPIYICNGAGVLTDFSGTYVGTESTYFTEVNNSSIDISTIVLTQNGSLFTSAISSNNGSIGTSTGLVNGNIYTFTNSYTQLPQGCTNTQASGMGFIQNNRFTYFYSGITVCNNLTLHFTGSGILTKQ